MLSRVFNTIRSSAPYGTSEAGMSAPCSPSTGMPGRRTTGLGGWRGFQEDRGGRATHVTCEIGTTASRQRTRRNPSEDLIDPLVEPAGLRRSTGRAAAHAEISVRCRDVGKAGTASDICSLDLRRIFPGMGVALHGTAIPT